MAIPQDSLSSDWPGTEGAYAVPEDRVFYAFVNFERGPIALEDPGQGLNYQNWGFSWDHSTGDITATPETTGTPSVVHNIPACSLISCTFDQNGRVAMAYLNGNAYLWWYDTALAQRVTTDLGGGIGGITLYLDDKRQTQSTANDMLLWYTKLNGSVYDLYMLKQRERFQTEHLMHTGLELYHLHNSGMSNNLRGQLSLRSQAPFT